MLLGSHLVVFRIGQGPDGNPVLYRITYNPSLEKVHRLFDKGSEHDPDHEEEIQPNALLICEDGVDHFAAVIPNGE